MSLDLDLLAQQLDPDNSDIETIIRVAIQLHDNIQHYVYGEKYARLLEKLAPILFNYLKGPLGSTSNSEKTKVLGDQFKPFLDLTQDVFDQITCNSIPGIPPQAGSQKQKSSPQQGSSVESISDLSLGLQRQTTPKAMTSFKVFALFPIIAKSIFLANPSLVSLYIKRFLLSIKRVLLLKAKAQEIDIAVFRELIRTQVNTLSLLAHLLEGPESQLAQLTELNDLLSILPDRIIGLLKDCSGEMLDVRIELLRTTRGIINQSHRAIFMKKFDELLDERILIGDSLTAIQTLRLHALNMVADFITCMRDTLNGPQIQKVVEVYAKSLQDGFLATNLQRMSVKLLLTITISIAKMPNKVKARHCLIMILGVIGEKFATMNRQYMQKFSGASPDNYLADIAKPIKRDPQGCGVHLVADNETLFEDIMGGLKSIFDVLKECSAGSPIGPYRFIAEEVQVFSKVFRGAANLLRYYKNATTKSQYTNPLELIAESYILRSNLKNHWAKTLVSVFLCIGPTTLHEIFSDDIQSALDRFPELPDILPALIQRYKQMNDLEPFFDMHTGDWANLLVWSAVDTTKHGSQYRGGKAQFFQAIKLRARLIFHTKPSYERIHDEPPDLEKGSLRTLGTRNSPFLAGLCKSLILPFQKPIFAVTSSLCIQHSVKIVIDTILDNPNKRRETWGGGVRAWLCMRLIRPFQQLIFAATSDYCMETSVMITIDALLDIEEAVHRTRNNTLRAKLYKFWNFFPEEFCSLLYRKIEVQKYGRFFAQTLEHPNSEPLRKVAGENVEILIKCAENGTQTMISSIHIMHSLCQLEGKRDWMGKIDSIWFKRVGENLEAHVRKKSLPSHLAAEQASEQLMDIFAKFLEYHHPVGLDDLLRLVESVTTNDFSETHPLCIYIHRYIICEKSIQFRKIFVMQSIEAYATASQKSKTFLIRNIVHPIIRRNSKQESSESPRLVDKAMIESIRAKIWKVGVGSPDDDLTQPGIDRTTMEVLQLTAMLVKYCPPILHDMWPDIIEFCWKYIRREDILIKHAAHVVVGYCVAHYEVPVEIIQTVYISLLESDLREARALVMQALELIAPVLPKLCSVTPDDRNPIWAAAPHQILTEGGRETLVFYFLANNPKIFYKYREKYITLIVQSLRTIAPPSSRPNERRELVLKLMGLVSKWEQQLIEDKREGSDKSEYETIQEDRTEMINYLVEYILNNDPIQSTERINSLHILRNLLQPQCWGDLDLSNIIKTLLEEPNSIVNVLKVVRNVADVRPDVLTTPLQEMVRGTFLKRDDPEILACQYETEITGGKTKSLFEHLNAGGEDVLGRR
ncbi:hypothetical protein OIDMADRAFT_149686 [Oidiodendron maius Zn]|uniref:Uncharacterized protein n=1 Tax=Oidiodendron maius (strain Zn) TaxID=913774 RepID=A0A0C3GQ36_OIDMZ|nr:hypothetical protein OIDMADRAFT_149686 [Oidiodendron maius Zn]